MADLRFQICQFEICNLQSRRACLRPPVLPLRSELSCASVNSVFMVIPAHEQLLDAGKFDILRASDKLTP